MIWSSDVIWPESIELMNRSRGKVEVVKRAKSSPASPSLPPPQTSGSEGKSGVSAGGASPSMRSNDKQQRFGKIESYSNGLYITRMTTTCELSSLCMRPEADHIRDIVSWSSVPVSHLLAAK
jgi:hypothetical protein